MTSSPVVAAVDCGTNSTRLLVSDGRTPVERMMRITRLGQGVDASGRLAAAAIDRTLSALRDYRAVMDRHGVTRLRAVATSAARDAANRDELLSAIEAVVGARPEVLTGDLEGRLSFAGATAELDAADGPFLVADIGGGSTEFAVGPGPTGPDPVGRGSMPEPDGVCSVDLGCVRVTEKFLHTDPPRPEELSQAFDVVRDHLEDVARELPGSRHARRLVGLAGTVTSLAAVEQGLPEYDRDRIHHFVLTRAAAEDVFRTLVAEPCAERVHNPGLELERADVIIGGAIVLVGILRFFDLDECLVSEADILDGLVMSQLA